MAIFFYLLVIVFLILFPTDTADTALHGLRIWGTSIVPTLFPYMIFSRLLCKSLQTLNLPAAPAVAALGILGGSPSGAAMIASRAARLSSKSIGPLCALVGTISPMFILGAMQAWTGDPLLCRRLLLCHWLSSLVCAGLVYLLYRRRKTACLSAQFSNTALSNPIAQSIDAILQVGGCVILYSVLAGILGRILRPFPLLHPYIHAILEISGGIHAICQFNLSSSAKCIALSAALGFSGLSILSQNHAMLRPLGIRMPQLLFFAVLRSFVSAILMALYMHLFPFN